MIITEAYFFRKVFFDLFCKQVSTSYTLCESRDIVIPLEGTGVGETHNRKEILFAILLLTLSLAIKRCFELCLATKMPMDGYVNMLLGYDYVGVPGCLFRNAAALGANKLISSTRKMNVRDSHFRLC